ncbi:hypothetical protein WJX72_011910 [[Myrmecia] bisecta]|uniref:Tetratricopeptide repeat protein n=1 Tax=[Myrmecia] bisecta TaxID=41462 RepID=A0AAW1RA62_9CHLO
MDTAIRLQPAGLAGLATRASLLRNRFYVKYQLGDVQGALADMNNAKQLLPEDNVNLSFLAVAKHWVGDLEGARADMARVKQPTDMNEVYTRSFVKRLQGDLEGALVDMEHAVQLCPDHAYFLWSWASRNIAKLRRIYQAP